MIVKASAQEENAEFEQEENRKRSLTRKNCGAIMTGKDSEGKQAVEEEKEEGKHQ